MAEIDTVGHGGLEELELAITGPGDVVEYEEDGKSYTVSATKTGIIFPQGLPFHVWEMVGNQLKIQKQQVQSDLDWLLWAIGDWLNYGEGTYGERHAQALESTDYAEGTLHNIASAAKRVEYRREDLSFWNHSEVGKLDKPQQQEVLDKAASEKWRRGEIREEATRVEQEQFGKAHTPVWEDCQHCVGRQYPPGKVPVEREG